MNYKDTLNLPSTKFPMKANLPQKEPETIKYWNEIKLYEEIRSERKGCKRFIKAKDVSFLCNFPFGVNNKLSIPPT